MIIIKSTRSEGQSEATVIRKSRGTYIEKDESPADCIRMEGPRRGLTMVPLTLPGLGMDRPFRPDARRVV